VVAIYIELKGRRVTVEADDDCSPDPTATDLATEGGIKDLWGAMRGTVTFLPDVDLTDPTGETWDAES
jgi:hypothetical protein